MERCSLSSMSSVRNTVNLQAHLEKHDELGTDKDLGDSSNHASSWIVCMKGVCYSPASLAVVGFFFCGLHKGPLS